jgi:hypothetical protein
VVVIVGTYAVALVGLADADLGGLPQPHEVLQQQVDVFPAEVGLAVIAVGAAVVHVNHGLQIDRLAVVRIDLLAEADLGIVIEFVAEIAELLLVEATARGVMYGASAPVSMLERKYPEKSMPPSSTTGAPGVEIAATTRPCTGIGGEMRSILLQ